MEFGPSDDDISLFFFVSGLADRWPGGGQCEIDESQTHMKLNS